MKTHKDVKIDDDKWNMDLSLERVLGKKIKDIHGYVTSEFGEDTLVFDITSIVLEDDTKMSVAGEHDIAYLYGEDFGEGVLENIYKTDPERSQD